MASFKVTGLEETFEYYHKIEKIPNDVTRRILNAMGEVIKKAQEESAKSMLSGPFYTGITAGSIALKEPKITETGGTVELTFKGSRTRGKTTTSNAAIAFINEFGKKGQAARPFIKTANEKSADEANEAGKKALFSWLGN